MKMLGGLGKVKNILTDTKKIIDIVNTNSNVLFKEVSCSLKKELNKINIDDSEDIDNLSLSGLVLRLTKEINNEVIDIKKQINGEKKNKGTNYVKKALNITAENTDDENTKNILIEMGNEIKSRVDNHKKVLSEIIKPLINDSKIIGTALKKELVDQSTNASIYDEIKDNLNECLGSIVTKMLTQLALSWYDFMKAYIYNKDDDISLRNQVVLEALQKIGNVLYLFIAYLITFIKERAPWTGIDEILQDSLGNESLTSNLLGLKKFLYYDNASIQIDNARPREILGRSVIYANQKESDSNDNTFGDLSEHELLRLVLYHLSSDPSLMYIHVKKEKSDEKELIKEIRAFGVEGIPRFTENSEQIYFASEFLKKVEECIKNDKENNLKDTKAKLYGKITVILDSTGSSSKNIQNDNNTNVFDEDSSDNDSSDDDSSDDDSSDDDMHEKKSIVKKSILSPLLMTGLGLAIVKRKIK